MPDHVHLAIRLRDKLDLSETVGLLKRSIRRAVALQGIEIAWQRGYVDRIVRDYETPQEVIKYILGNPDRAGLLASGGAYPYRGVVDLWW